MCLLLWFRYKDSPEDWLTYFLLLYGEQRTRTAGAQDGEGGSGGYGRQVESPLHNRQKGQIDIMPRSNRAGRAISVIFTVYRERERENE